VKRAALGALLVISALLLVVRAPAALAHTELILSDPADGAVVAQVPAQVSLTFSEELIPDTVRISVVDATGLAVLVADPVVDADTVTVAWPPGLTGTSFGVNYRVVSQDGHPVSGTVSFSTTASASTGPAASTAASAPAPSVPASVPASSPAAAGDGSGSSVQPGVLVAVVVAAGIAIGAVALLTRRRRTRA
jgi:copper resistance protein C